jgi:Ca2+-binding EF-hand superfamily protein
MEFLLAVSLASSKDPVRKIELFFSMYDVDHNGLIDENEMRSFVEVYYYLKYSSNEIFLFFV